MKKDGKSTGNWAYIGVVTDGNPLSCSWKEPIKTRPSASPGASDSWMWPVVDKMKDDIGNSCGLRIIWGLEGQQKKMSGHTTRLLYNYRHIGQETHSACPFVPL